MEENEQLFFNMSDSTKIKTFLQIPKALFVNPLYKKLPLSCKLAYSIYLQRYSITKYSDEIGPYIIFSDKEVSQLIDTTEKHIAQIRRKLQSVGLISYKRSVSFNKIYVYSYNKENAVDKVFYHEDDIESWRFYRYPSDFFESKYDNLPIEAKMIYAIYFDTMCLSKANYFTDNMERIYFQESYIEQELKSNFSNNTLKKYRNYLKACNLLYEYQPFGQKMRYYLIKLDMYEDNVFIYEQLEDVDKSIFIQNKMNYIKENYIDLEKGHDIQFIKKGIKSLKLTREAVTELIYERTGKMISVSGLKKYLNETRKMPEDIYNFLCDYIEKNTGQEESTKFVDKTPIYKNGPTVSQNKGVQVSQIKDIQDKKYEDISFEDKVNKESQISFDGFISNQPYISNTTDNINNTDIKYTLIKECKNQIESINELIKEDKELLIDVFDYIAVQDFIQTKKTVYRDEDMHSLLQFYINNAKNISISLLNRLYSGQKTFYSPENVIKYFITMLINDYELQQQNPVWFQSGGIFDIDEYRSRIRERYPQQEPEMEFSESSKHFKWWED